MRVYLDTCSLQRPLDSKSQIRIMLEAEAVLGILALCESGEIALISSEVLRFETGRNPNVTRQEYAREVLSKATLQVAFSSGVEKRARELTALGLKPLDALHLASAEEGQADYLCTCDDGFLKKVNPIKSLATKVVSPVELMQEIEKWQSKQNR